VQSQVRRRRIIAEGGARQRASPTLWAQTAEHLAGNGRQRVALDHGQRGDADRTQAVSAGQRVQRSPVRLMGLDRPHGRTGKNVTGCPK